MHDHRTRPSDHRQPDPARLTRLLLAEDDAPARPRTREPAQAHEPEQQLAVLLPEPEPEPEHPLARLARRLLARSLWRAVLRRAGLRPAGGAK